ncbi:MAG: ribosome biogenesis/translation initiation ATPase RLI [Sulfolobales archaeon]
MVRLAVIDYDSCHPDKCGNMPCVRFCPINRGGTIAIEPSDEKKGKPIIYETICIGCGICVKKCPFEAITILNLPDELERNVIHRYGVNAFKLYGLPTPISGKIVGILGRNGTGKTTALKILGGEILPNFGELDKKIDYDYVLRRFRGTELYNHFKELADKKIRVIHKIQRIELIQKYIRGSVREVLSKIDERGVLRDLIDTLSMQNMLDKSIRELSGGELQKLAIAAALSRQGDLYLFDEPSSYLDVRERLRIATTIRDLVPPSTKVLVVEHDLAVLDYISDYVSIVYGEPGAYGIFSKIYGVGAGINHFLQGFLPAENMLIRKEPIRFLEKEVLEETSRQSEKRILVSWSRLVKRLGEFSLEVEEGEVYRSEVLGVLGPNAIGKTTFVRLIAGELKPDEGETTSIGLRISYKPQFITPSGIGGSEDDTVEDFLKKKAPELLNTESWIYIDVTRKLSIHKLLQKKLGELSGGELQKIAVAIALAQDADLYLLDEPSAHIDVEDRITVAKAIRRSVENKNIAAIVVDHDLNIIDYLSDRIIVFKGEPGVRGYAESPKGLRKSMNSFLSMLNVTFRRDPKTKRPRMNKPGSYFDRLQRELGEYYYTPKEEVSD